LAKSVLVVLISFGLIGYIPSANNSISQIRHYAIESLSAEKPKDRIWRTLKKLGTQSENLDYLVYLPKDEYFWEVCRPHDITLVPLLSKRASLYGLGSCGWGAENYYMWGNWGFHSYSRELFSLSISLEDPTHKELCLETRRLGFSGFFVIRETSIIKESCENI